MKKTAAVRFILAAILCLTGFMVISGQLRSRPSDASEKISEIADGWYYIENDQVREVTLPALITLDSGEDLVLYCTGLTAEAAGQTLTTRGALYRLNISIGGRTLYQYDDSAFPRNTQMASRVNCTATLPKDYSGEAIAFTYENTGEGTYQVEKVFTGTSLAVFFYQCSRDMLSLVTIFVMALLGIFSVGVYLYLRYMDVNEKRFADIAFFLLCCVCWLLTDSSMAQMYSDSHPVILYVSFYAFMLLAVPMLHFIKSTESMKSCRAIDAMICAFYLNAILQGLLNYLGFFDFVEMLFVTHLLLLGGIAALLYHLIRTFLRSGDWELKNILISFAVVASGGTISLFLYWLLQISYYEIFFECGIVIMILLLTRTLIIVMVENLKFRTEALVYQRLAKEDHLTGMKNRRAFDEMVAEIERDAPSYGSLYLIFMDLNYLKNINDTQGHHTGDELIVAAAQCVENAFASRGTCFRIGGDEFCAIVPDSGLDEAQLSALLDEEVRLYNSLCSRYRISIARGISNLRDSDGSLKSVSDWKEEADLKMYENKGWVRRTT